MKEKLENGRMKSVEHLSAQRLTISTSLYAVSDSITSCEGRFLFFEGRSWVVSEMDRGRGSYDEMSFFLSFVHTLFFGYPRRNGIDDKA